MTQFFEILKYTLPGLIVFATAYYLLKQYLDATYNMKNLEQSYESSSKIIPIKLQAYERLILLCERMRIVSALHRLNAPNMTVNDLRTSLLISIQKEFEHNLAQKLYISKSLWNIIELSKNDVLNIVTETSNQFPDEDISTEYANALIAQGQNQNKSPINVAIAAIKEEAKIILGSN